MILLNKNVLDLLNDIQSHFGFDIDFDSYLTDATAAWNVSVSHCQFI